MVILGNISDNPYCECLDEVIASWAREID